MDVEERIRAAFDAGDLREAATICLTQYGPELMGYIYATMRNELAADDVWSVFCEDLWSGIDGFRWESRFQTWVYTLARNACNRYFRDPYKRRGRRFNTGEISHVVEHIRTNTKPYLKTEVKSEVRKLRERLTPDEQTLLILRLDRKMSWQDVAMILSSPEDQVSVAACRKRFQRIKQRLAKWVVEEGLVDRETT